MTGPKENFVARYRDRLADRLTDCEDELIDLYTLLAVVLGTEAELFDVHNAWAVWRNRTNPEHRSLIPFPMLAPEVQELDQPYLAAIREVAEAVEREGDDATGAGT